MTTNLTIPGELLLTKLGINPSNLVADFPANKLDQYIAVVNWLKKYKSKSDTTNLEKVKGYLEAFYYLGNVKDWERATTLILVPIDITPNKELHELLNFWGEYREQIKLYEQIIDKVELSLKIKFTNCLAKAYYDLGDNDSAEIEHNNALEFALQINNQQQQGLALRGLGKTCYRGDLNKARIYFEQQLEIARAIDDKEQLIMAKHNITQVRLDSPKTQDSLSLYKDIIEQRLEALKLCQEINDRKSEAIVLTGLGDCYVRLGDNSRARNYYSQAKQIYEEIQDSRSIRSLNHEFGLVCFEESRFEESVLYFKQYVSFCEKEFEEQYNSQRLMESYKHLSQVLNIINRSEEALIYAHKLFNLANTHDDKYFASFVYGNIYSSLGQLEEALNNYECALNFANEINHLELIIDCLINIAHCHNDIGNHRYAIRYSNKACKKSSPKILFDDPNYRDRFSCALGEFGVACRELGKYDVAIKTITKALEIAIELNDNLNVSVQKRDLGLTYLARGNYDQALNYLCESQTILQDICFPEEQFRTFIAISQFYLKLSDYNKSLLYYEIAKDIASKLSPIFQIKCDGLKLQIDREMSDQEDSK
jgi:tetratricopeptide (TPR) repeat protein